MPLGIFKTTKAYLYAWKYTFSYSPLVLWWPPLSHFKEKGVFFLTSPWFEHLFKITYNLPHTANGRCTKAVASRCLLYTMSYRPHCAPGVSGQAVAW